MKFLFNLMTFLVDLNHKKKIVSFFKTKLKNNPINIIDVGAHKGETIDIFYKNFNISKIFAFEANPLMFGKIKKKN